MYIGGKIACADDFKIISKLIFQVKSEGVMKAKWIVIIVGAALVVVGTSLSAGAETQEEFYTRIHALRKVDGEYEQAAQEALDELPYPTLGTCYSPFLPGACRIEIDTYNLNFAGGGQAELDQLVAHELGHAVNLEPPLRGWSRS